MLMAGATVGPSGGEPDPRARLKNGCAKEELRRAGLTEVFDERAGGSGT